MAQAGIQVELFEASPKPGGRTRSFIDKASGELCDNGPHLLIGAYQATQQLLSDCNATSNLVWQPSLKLPLWDVERNHFQLFPAPWLPFPLALLMAVRSLPAHGWASAVAMLRLARALNQDHPADTSVSDLIRLYDIPPTLVSDMLEPICLGSMNEDIHSADASTFKRILRESFASKKTARLGWFNAPLDLALIKPLVERAEQLGVNIRTRQRVRSLKKEADAVLVNGDLYDAVVIALPAFAADALLDRESQSETRCITNVHLWFEANPGLPETFVGGIRTTGQWFFDITAQMQQQELPLYHICAVISADEQDMDDATLLELVTHELNLICNSSTHLSPCHFRIIREKRATVLVRKHDASQMASVRMIDATEQPLPGELPATIEFAVQRGEKAAIEVLKLLL
ncbi:hypothetical protein MMIC_P2087 [Mariprofundus micogutta]|uniref:Amine oxidase domain-containing protein n=1 Tax=Mariprofundus micogutta TaxID=1921010 RepID=A0A1L8CQB7_9PROT|nr:hypothetical protein MMIC_P2087 [Mariprofundus micogutta]